MLDTGKLEITYLLNSGFLVRQGRRALLFDCFEDPSGTLVRIVPELEELYIFASHAHFDHYSEQLIGKYQGQARRIFLSEDIRTLRPRLQEEKIVWLAPYSRWAEGGGQEAAPLGKSWTIAADQRELVEDLGCMEPPLRVTSFSSTDEGTSFLVEWEGCRIFHAGDFNWWHWEGDTEENNKLARNGFVKQMKRLAGLECDIALFPIDGRQEKAQGWGAKEFCAQTVERLLVGMHSVGYPRWQAPGDFFQQGKEVPVWAPVQPGEKFIF